MTSAPPRPAIAEANSQPRLMGTSSSRGVQEETNPSQDCNEQPLFPPVCGFSMKGISTGGRCRSLQRCTNLKNGQLQRTTANSFSLEL
eukprot:3490038-Rhodomonas_salina.1